MSLNSDEAFAAFDRIVGRVREIAGEHDEIRLALEAVDRGHRFLERALGVGIGRPFEPPVRIRQLHEVEVVLPCRQGHARQARGEHHAAESREFQKVPSVDRF